MLGIQKGIMMHENIKKLKKYFPATGAAETERSIWPEVYIEPPCIEKLMDFSSSKFKILSGPKGSGKSLLLNAIFEKSLAGGNLATYLEPTDINCDAIIGHSSTSNKINEAYEQLSEKVVEKIAETFSLAIKSDSVYLQRFAEQKCNKRNRVDALANVLTSIAPQEIQVAAKYLLDKGNIHFETKETTAKMASYLSRNNIKYILLIDNVDQAVEENQGRFDYSSAWSIFHACYNLCNKVPNMVCIISVRTDIWHLLTRIKNFGTDILDKIEKPVEISVDDNLMKSIFDKRISVAFSSLLDQQKMTPPICSFFEKESIELPGRSEINRRWEQYFSKQARNRPRDLIQLVNQIIESTSPTGLITSGNAIANQKTFAQSRVENICVEYYQICSQLRSILPKLWKKTRYSFNEYLEAGNQACGVGVLVDGVSINTSTKKDVLRLFRILHMANFINPRVEDSTMPEGYRHILFQDNKNYFNEENFNDLQKAIFELHPVFHILRDA